MDPHQVLPAAAESEKRLIDEDSLADAEQFPSVHHAQHKASEHARAPVYTSEQTHQQQRSHREGGEDRDDAQVIEFGDEANGEVFLEPYYLGGWLTCCGAKCCIVLRLLGFV
jgi:hypothetical protein